MGNGILLVGIAILIGVGGALALTRFMSSMLFGVVGADPATYATVAILLITVGALAYYLPARRAGNIDPLQALHYE